MNNLEPFIFPQLEPFRTTIRVSSFENPHTFYEVDLKNLTCSCPDFAKTRNRFPTTDIRRLCKHLVRAVCDDEAIKQLPGHMAVLIRSAAGRKKGMIPQAQYLETWTETSGKIVLCGPKNGWYNIVSKVPENRNQYDEYGYNVSEDRWSNDKYPPDASKIESIISDHYQSQGHPAGLSHQTSSETDNSSSMTVLIFLALFFLIMILLPIITKN